MTKDLNVLKKVDRVTEEERLNNLYNKIIQVILKGKCAKEEPKKKIRGSQLLRQKLEKFDKE